MCIQCECIHCRRVTQSLCWPTKMSDGWDLFHRTKHLSKNSLEKRKVFVRQFKPLFPDWQVIQLWFEQTWCEGNSTHPSSAPHSTQTLKPMWNHISFCFVFYSSLSYCQIIHDEGTLRAERRKEEEKEEHFKKHEGREPEINKYINKLTQKSTRTVNQKQDWTYNGLHMN